MCCPESSILAERKSGCLSWFLDELLFYVCGWQKKETAMYSANNAICFKNLPGLLLHLVGLQVRETLISLFNLKTHRLPGKTALRASPLNGNCPGGP